MLKKEMLAGLAFALSAAAAMAAEPEKDAVRPDRAEAPAVQPEPEKAEAKALKPSRPGLMINDNYLRLGIANDAFVGSVGQR